MRITLLSALLIVVSALLLAGQASAHAQRAHAVKTVTVVMHDPGCHWFAAGAGFKKTLTVRGSVALLNVDEATLKVVGPTGLKLDKVGHKLILGRGHYRINMVGQAPSDNTLWLTVA
jgi:hypothetical protein